MPRYLRLSFALICPHKMFRFLVEEPISLLRNRQKIVKMMNKKLPES